MIPGVLGFWMFSIFWIWSFLNKGIHIYFQLLGGLKQSLKTFTLALSVLAKYNGYNKQGYAVKKELILIWLQFYRTAFTQFSIQKLVVNSGKDWAWRQAGAVVEWSRFMSLNDSALPCVSKCI